MSVISSQRERKAFFLGILAVLLLTASPALSQSSGKADPILPSPGKPGRAVVTAHLDALGSDGKVGGEEPVLLSAACPATVRFKGRITSQKAGEVTYKFVRSDGGKMSTKTLKFEQPGTQSVETSWKLGRNFSGWMAIEIETPVKIQSNRASFEVECNNNNAGQVKNEKTGSTLQTKPQVYKATELKKKKTKITELKDTDIIEHKGKRITVSDLKARIQSKKQDLAQRNVALKNIDTGKTEQIMTSGEAIRASRVQMLQTGIAEQIIAFADRNNILTEEPLHIDSIYPETVSPGDPILIRGTGFGPKNYVDVSIPGKTTTRLVVKSWSSTAIEATMPVVTGLAGPATATVLVHSAKNVSVFKNIVLTPTMEVISLINHKFSCNLSDETDHNNYYPTDKFFYAAEHYSIVVFKWWGDEGTDYCLEQLKNGWEVEYVEFKPNPVDWGWGGTITPVRIPKKGDKKIDIAVKWEVEPNGGIFWGIKINIKGPKGVPYK